MAPVRKNEDTEERDYWRQIWPILEQSENSCSSHSFASELQNVDNDTPSLSVSEPPHDSILKDSLGLLTPNEMRFNMSYWLDHF